jgi:hypothetical protein
MSCNIGESSAIHVVSVRTVVERNGRSFLNRFFLLLAFGVIDDVHR